MVIASLAIPYVLIFSEGNELLITKMLKNYMLIVLKLKISTDVVLAGAFTDNYTQKSFICTKSTTETPEKDVKYA